MNKKWVKHYLFIGTVLVVIIAVISSFAFIAPNLRKTQEKHEFDSMYEDTSIDFIVPSPSYEQVDQEEQDASNGIGVLTPFFSTTTDVRIDGNRVNVEVLMFPDASKMNHTPYCADRIVQGASELNPGDAVVDQNFISRNGGAIGDEVVISIREYELSYTIVSISENNLLEDEGSIAVVLDPSDVQQFVDDQMTYTAAYVEADNYSVCKNYLDNDYKPYGRLKPASAFSSDDVYNEHYDNFMNADWSKEITNFADNYDALKVKYANYESSFKVNLVIASSLVGIALFVYQLVVLGNQTLKKFMQNYLVKKNGIVSKVSNFFVSGVVFMLCIYIVIIGVLYYLSASKISSIMILSGIWNAIIPAGVAVAVSLLMIVISSITIKTRFSAKKIQEWKEIERKKQEAQRQQGTIV